MPFLLWDASALAKRYVMETGSPIVDALFQAVPPSSLIATVWGYAETFAILVRQHNGGIIQRPSFLKAVSALRTEIVESPDVTLLTIDDDIVFASLPFVQKYNLNTTDAALLTAFLRYATSTSETCLLMTADQRLLRAAQSEGLQALDPEASLAQDIPTYLATLSHL